MKQFNKITIIGVGLIGGSIGLASRRKKLAAEIIGVCRHQSSLQKARRLKAIDQGSLDLQQAVRGADLVVLACPVNQIIKTAKKIAPYLQPRCVLTDVGSTKLEIVQTLEKVLPQEVYFVGAHPLAGSEKRGVTNARAQLFCGRLCIITKTANTNAAALKKVVGFWTKIGCRIEIFSPQRHDQVVALISHLPHLAAGQLVKVARNNLDFAASGFADTTRIASSGAEIWSDIFLTNKEFIIQAVNEYIKNLKLVRDWIANEDKAKLIQEFREIKTLRDGLQR